MSSVLWNPESGWLERRYKVATQIEPKICKNIGEPKLLHLFTTRRLRAPYSAAFKISKLHISSIRLDLEADSDTNEAISEWRDQCARYSDGELLSLLVKLPLETPSLRFVITAVTGIFENQIGNQIENQTENQTEKFSVRIEWRITRNALKLKNWSDGAKSIRRGISGWWWRVKEEFENNFRRFGSKEPFTEHCSKSEEYLVNLVSTLYRDY